LEDKKARIDLPESKLRLYKKGDKVKLTLLEHSRVLLKVHDDEVV